MQETDYSHDERKYHTAVTLFLMLPGMEAGGYPQKLPHSFLGALTAGVKENIEGTYNDHLRSIFWQWHEKLRTNVDKSRF